MSGAQRLRGSGVLPASESQVPVDYGCNVVGLHTTGPTIDCPLQPSDWPAARLTHIETTSHGPKGTSWPLAHSPTLPWAPVWGDAPMRFVRRVQVITCTCSKVRRRFSGHLLDMGEARGSEIAFRGPLSTFSSARLQVGSEGIKSGPMRPTHLGSRCNVPRKWNYSLPARHGYRLIAVLGTSHAQLLLCDRASTKDSGSDILGTSSWARQI